MLIFLVGSASKIEGVTTTNKTRHTDDIKTEEEQYDHEEEEEEEDEYDDDEDYDIEGGGGTVQFIIRVSVIY